MKEKTLLRVAISCSIVGILVLFYFSDTVTIGNKEISNIQSDVGRNIKVNGIVVSVKDLGTFSVVKIEQQKTETMDVVLFKAKNISLNAGEKIEVSGQLEEYNGKLELIGNEIKK